MPCAERGVLETRQSVLAIRRDRNTFHALSMSYEAVDGIPDLDVPEESPLLNAEARTCLPSGSTFRSGSAISVNVFIFCHSGYSRR